MSMPSPIGCGSFCGLGYCALACNVGTLFTPGFMYPPGCCCCGRNIGLREMLPEGGMGCWPTTLRVGEKPL